MCDWLGIVPEASYWNPDTSIGSFTQSERDYSDKVKFLLDNGFAYYAFDTKDDLDILKSKGLKYDSTTRMSMNNSLTKPDTDIKSVPYSLFLKTISTYKYALDLRGASKLNKRLYEILSTDTLLFAERIDVIFPFDKGDKFSEEYDKVKDELSVLLEAMKQACIGIENLKFTYQNDKSVSSTDEEEQDQEQDD
jgi:hypothetical protein